MALVTDMSGECRAGVTPHTVWYPTMPARPKVVTIWVKAALGADRPRPNRVAKPGTKRDNVKGKRKKRDCGKYRIVFTVYLIDMINI